MQILVGARKIMATMTAESKSGNRYMGIKLKEHGTSTERGIRGRNMRKRAILIIIEIPQRFSSLFFGIERIAAKKNNNKAKSKSGKEKDNEENVITLRIMENMEIAIVPSGLFK